jgi:hypothetical protein
VHLDSGDAFSGAIATNKTQLSFEHSAVLTMGDTAEEIKDKLDYLRKQTESNRYTRRYQITDLDILESNQDVIANVLCDETSHINSSDNDHFSKS